MNDQRIKRLILILALPAAVLLGACAKERAGCHSDSVPRRDSDARPVSHACPAGGYRRHECERGYGYSRPDAL